MQGRSNRRPAEHGAPRGSDRFRGRTARGVGATLARAVALAATGLLVGALAPPAAADVPDNVIVNGHFDTGDFTGWSVGIRPDRANGGAPSLFNTPSGWVVSKDPQTDGSLSLNPINGFTAFNGFSGSPAGLQFFLSQPFTFNAPLHDAILKFTFDVVGGPTNPGAKARTFEVVVTSMGGHDRAKLFSYSIPGTDANPKQTVTLDLKSTLNSIGPAGYMLEFRETVPEGDTGPAIFAVDDVSMQITQNCTPKPVCPPNRTIQCPTLPTTAVVLEGSAFDEEGDPLDFVWTEGNTLLGRGPRITVQLAPGQHTIRLTVSDPLGEGSCEFTVTIQDNIPPEITCPGPITATLDPVTCVARANFTVSATDNCPGVTVECRDQTGRIVRSGDTFPVGTNTVTCKATDAAGNMDTCTFTVTVPGSVVPRITCPTNLIVSTEPGRCDAVVNYNATVEGCPTPTLVCTPPPGTRLPVGTHTVTCTATNAAGTATCTFTVTVRDLVPPTITCPPNMTVPNADKQCGRFVRLPDITATDNCPGRVNVVCNPPSGSFFPVGTTMVTCTATDAGGNVSTCTFTVTVIDTDMPKPLCPDRVIVRAIEAGTCSARLNFEPPIWTNCPDATMVCRDQTGRIVDSNSLFQAGTHTITCTATDTAGNSFTCSYTLRVEDWEKPMIDVPADIEVRVAPGVTQATVTLPNATATDNCPGVTVSCEREDTGTNLTAPFQLGTTIVICTATDAAGNIRRDFFRVRVLVQPGGGS